MNEVMELTSIQRLEEQLLKMPQAPIETIHSFPPGKYERKIVIPPWTVLTGAEHKTDYVVRLEAGSIAVNTDDGVKLLNAPLEFSVKAGIKRAGRVFEEQVIWVDVYENPDGCTDIPTLEERYYVVPEMGLGETRQAKRIAEDRQDYASFLEQIGISPETMEEVVNTDDLIPMPDGYSVELRPSLIHGMGMFALRSYQKGEYICPGRLDGHRTPAGRFINHSSRPNTKPVRVGDDIHAVALEDIQMNEEILIDYRTSMLVNIGMELGERECQAG
jgi:hypothetical protein